MEINKAEKLLKALANRRRLKTLAYLRKNGKASVGELSDYLKLSFKSTSKHLLALKVADLVESEQVGLTRFYFLVQPLDPLVKLLLASF